MTPIEAGVDTVVHVRHLPTPAEIVSWLPSTATEAQKDSAIQAHIKPCEIHWSQRPDTLRLPGQPLGKSVLDTSLPQYYKESFFSGKDCFHPEIAGGRQGVAGDPMPYTIAGDDIMTTLLLVCFALTLVSVTRSWAFIQRQIKNFTYVPRGATSEIGETGAEIRFQLLLVVQSCLLFAVLCLMYMTYVEPATYTVGQIRIMELATGVFAAYYVAKHLLYGIVNWTFFDYKKSQQWTKTALFLAAGQGLALFPLVFVQSFFGMPLTAALIYLISVLAIFKLLAFYKQMQIFFQQNSTLLQNILYFCTLELVPLSILCSVLGIIRGILVIKF